MLRRPIGENRRHLAPRQPPALANPAWLVGDSDLENGLCQFHRDGRRMLHGLLLSRAAMNSNHVGTSMPFTWTESPSHQCSGLAHRLRLFARR